MKVLVLGAGILGTCSAWYLNERQHTVTLVERQAEAALETSFANGSQISVSYAEPWANPQAPAKLVKWLLRDDSPLLFRLRADPNQWRWGLQFLRECAPTRTRSNTIQLTRLGLYSRECLIELRRATGITYDELALGILHLFETEAEFAAARPGLELMREFGCPMDFLTPAETIAIEPALGSYRERLVGAAHAPADESGDAFKFTQRLAARAAAQGVDFRYGTSVVRLLVEGGQVGGVLVRHGDVQEVLRADAYVVALGSWSAPLLRGVGVPTLIYPAKGYSATLPIRPGALANSVSITDHQMKIVFSRLGERIRIAGTAELNGYEMSLNPVRCHALTARAEELFPGVLDVGQAQFWTGLRPATPSNVPYIGRSPLPNLWLNAGHGTLGWTHGAGSGRALADLISGRRPEVDFAFC